MSDDPILAALARLEAGHAALRADVQADLGNMRAGVLADLGNMRADLGNMRIDFLGELGRTRSDLMERMDRLQHRLDDLDEHLTMGLGNSDRVERKSDGVAEQNRLLAEQVTTMHKLLRRLEGRINDLEERK